MYFLFTWNQGTFNFEADVAPEEQDFLVSINPESLLLEGARRVDEWSLIEKKIPSFDLVFEVDRSKLAASERRADRRSSDGRARSRSTARRDVAGDRRRIRARRVRGRQGAVRAGHRRLHPSRRQDDSAVDAAVVRGARRRAPQPRRRVLQDRDARRGAARVPPRARAAQRRSRRRASTSGSCCARQGKWEDALAAFTEAAAQPGAKPPCFTTSPTRSSSCSRYDEARARWTKRCGAAAATDPRVQTSLGVVCSAGGRSRRGADAALAAARPLFGKRPPTPAWFHYAALAAALLGDVDARGGVLSGGRRRASARRRRCSTTSPRSSSGAADYDDALRGRRARRARGRRAARSCTRISATCTTAPAATTRRSSRICAR